MKWNKILLFLCIIIIFICLIGCSRKTGLLSEPDKIIVYSNGKQKIIKKSHPIYNDITMLTNKRFNSKIYINRQQNDINRSKNDLISLEFIYNEEQESNLIGENICQFSYTRLFFPLVVKEEQQDEEETMYYGNGIKYNSKAIINLSTSNELINKVNNLVGDN